MKKYILLLIPLFIMGCEKTYDTVIDPGTSSVKVRSISSIVYKQYAPGDSTITPSLSLFSSSDVNSVYIDVYSSDNSKLNSSPVYLFDDGDVTNHGDQQAGDNSFSNKFPLSEFYPNGKYNIEYYVVDKSNTSQIAAKQTFTYDNNQTNIAPILSDLIAPDTIIVIDSAFAQLSVVASDSNGLSDIESVYFQSYRPDGTTNGNKFYLLDDGAGANGTSGDLVAGDGIYSLIVKVYYTSTKGLWRFDFQAEDRLNKFSNLIPHNILIQ